MPYLNLFWDIVDKIRKKQVGLLLVISEWKISSHFLLSSSRSEATIGKLRHARTIPQTCTLDRRTEAAATSTDPPEGAALDNNK